MKDAKDFWSEGLDQVPAYVPGEQPQGGGWIKLNTNECPYGPSPKAIAAMRDADDDRLRLYPEPSGEILREAVAKIHGVPAQDVFCGNGSDEVLAFAFRAFFGHGDPVLFPDVTYSFYPIWARAFGYDFRTIPLREDFTIDPADYAVAASGVVFPNPNAPTSIGMCLDGVRSILRSQSRRVVIVDEAYVDFGGESAIPLVKEFPNLVVVHTFSKSRSLAGLRASFAVASPGLVPALERVRDWYNSYTLDRIAQAGAAAALLDTEWTRSLTSRVVATRERFGAALVSKGWSVLPSQANFVFASHPSRSAQEVLAHLRDRRILVRAFRGPRLDRHVRITIGTDLDMDKVLEALDGF
ncbi:MAG TPA: histidinol-phosphate transaminase [Fibrobacteria bacterium]|nr:histidinol-phosphate transaminase [Fibrobacteria bacterium]HOX52327.1 histidinol-phosphate transaminase [Fibrobacteria bacterium]